MSDYIKREELIHRMYHEAFETDTDLQKWDSGCWIRYKLFENVIDDIPSADVVERKRGEWILTPYTDSGSPIHECSVCTHGVSGDLKVRNFCPNCGADMRADRKE